MVGRAGLAFAPGSNAKDRGGGLLPVTLLLSVLLALIPLAGIAWIVITKSLTSVDGLFMSLILLTLSGVFVLNAVFEMDARGWLAFLHKDKAVTPKEPPAAKAG
jgi:hypothetical protein